MIVAPHFTGYNLFTAEQITFFLKRMQDGVERAGTHVISMPPQFLHKFQPIDLLAAGMVEDMDANEAQIKVTQ